VKKVGKYYVCEVCGFYRNEDESKVRKHESMHKKTEPIVAFKEELKEMFGKMFSEVKTLSERVAALEKDVAEVRVKISELEKGREVEEG